MQGCWEVLPRSPVPHLLHLTRSPEVWQQDGPHPRQAVPQADEAQVVALPVAQQVALAQVVNNLIPGTGKTVPHRN